MNLAPTIAVWLMLLLCMAVELAVAQWLPGLRFALPFIGVGMALLVALTFMRLGSSRGLMPVFALAGVFWLCVLLGMGSLDSFTRRDIPIAGWATSAAP